VFWKWINLINWTVGILGFGFAIYSYVNCLPFRRLTFYADPASALLVKAGQSSKLAVTYDNQPIKTDVVAAQVVLWNAGTLPIKPEHVRQPITIQTVPPKPILELSFRIITPEREKIINPLLDKSEAAQGRARISWDLLEQDDGFQIQIIFAGPPDTQLVPAGVLEGQKRVAVLSLEPKDWFYKLILYTFVALVLATFALVLFIRFGPRRWRTAAKRRFIATLAGIMVLALALCVLILIRVLALRLQRPIPQSLVTPGLADEIRKKQKVLMSAPF
jgi:hypothetical protein